MIPRHRTAIAARAFLTAGIHATAGDIARFETAFAARLHSRHAVAAGAGQAGLVAALVACGLQPGDQVVLPALTRLELPRLLLRQGWVPVFADVDPHTLLLDPHSVRRVLTQRTRAVVPTDLFGNSADWHTLLAGDARAVGARIVQDAAHSAGTTLHGRQVGKRSDVACFRLETGTLLHAFGGGVAATDDADLARRLRERLADLHPPRGTLPARFVRNTLENLAFRTPAYALTLIALERPTVRAALRSSSERLRRDSVAPDSGWTNWQARFASEQLADLDVRVARHRRAAEQIASGLEGVVTFQRESPGVASNRSCLVGTVEAEPAAVRRAVLQYGVDVGIASEITDFCPDGAQAERCPHARHAYAHLIQLPLHADLDERETDRIVRAVAHAVRIARSARGK